MPSSFLLRCATIVSDIVGSSKFGLFFLTWVQIGSADMTVDTAFQVQSNSESVYM